MPYDTGTGSIVNMLANPPNPWEELGKTVQGVTALRDFQAKRAIGDIYQQSIDPETGQLDLGKFNAGIQRSPAAAWAAGPNMQQSGQAQSAQGFGTQQDVAAKLAQLEALSTQMGPLLGDIQARKDVTKEQAQAFFDQGKDLMTPQARANFQKQLDQIPEGGSARSLILGTAFAGERARAVLQGMGPQPHAYGVGSGTRIEPMNPLSPASQIGGGSAYLPSTLAPGEVANLEMELRKRTQWQGADGQPVDGTYEQWLREKAGITDPAAVVARGGRLPMPEAGLGGGGGPPPAAAPSGAPSASGGAPPVTAAPRPGGYPPPRPATAAPAPGEGGAPTVQPRVPGQPAGAPPVSGQPPIVAAPPPGAAAAPPAAGGYTPLQTGTPSTQLPQKTLDASTDVYNADLAYQKTLAERQAPIIQGMSILRANPKLQTVGQEQLTNATQILKAFGIDTGHVTTANAYQELAKNLAQIAGEQPGADRSDLGTLEGKARSPHIGQGREAITNLMGKALGVTRMRAAAIQRFQGMYPSPEEAAKAAGVYTSKIGHWMAEQDPVAWATNEMTTKEVQAYVKGLSDKQKRQFEKSRNAAKDVGNIGGPLDFKEKETTP